MTSGRGLLRQHPLRPAEASGCRRRLAFAGLLQLLNPRPGRRTLPLARGDEGFELGAGELGHVGADRLPDERGTFHASNLAPATCRKRVGTLHRSRVSPAVEGL
jgi:hypothetical protein